MELVYGNTYTSSRHRKPARPEGGLARALVDILADCPDVIPHHCGDGRRQLLRLVSASTALRIEYQARHTTLSRDRNRETCPDGGLWTAQQRKEIPGGS